MAKEWEAIENGKRWAIFPAGPLGEASILSVSTMAFDQEGIARLAAAAPELLAALKEFADEFQGEDGFDRAMSYGLDAILIGARAAIAKAESPNA